MVNPVLDISQAPRYNFSVLSLMYPSLGKCVCSIEELASTQSLFFKNCSQPWDIFPGDFEDESVFSFIHQVNEVAVYYDTFFSAQFIPFQMRISMFDELLCECIANSCFHYIPTQIRIMVYNALSVLTCLRNIKGNWFLSNSPPDKYGNARTGYTHLSVYKSVFEILIVFHNWQFEDFYLLPLDT
jgi:hypothetical protein